MTASPRPPVVLDLDGSVAQLAGERRLALAQDWQERLRFGCGLPCMQAFARVLQREMPPCAAHGTVFMGSGDFHHLSWPLVARCIAAHGHTTARPLRVVVLDNHPDNMRYPFGVHCGSWVRRVALLPQVAQVHVIGITSADIGAGHAWENYLRPLLARRLTYWSVGVDTGWARWLGIGAQFRTFADADSLVDACSGLLAADGTAAYLSIDKDVFAPSVVRTNWDQGVFQVRHAAAIAGALRGRLAGSDVTGDVSQYRYRSAWKRLLSGRDGQDTAAERAELPAWQAAQGALNGALRTLLDAAA
ncbi:hypothetical protein [Pseudorhodoferax sp. Leaf274]|uniref:hypothetical protein n=1 Tax=Pseudorhodoferax sp. Leaf274 TaxID=1736318 RepID=UPI0007027F9F|nr:hypothetical protein [Pseudorhodoferax sp. Leaf274]KQP48561.1 hypothetical protein ASF44_21885 [Pseudorhodoferax sp. Leaf274]